MKKIKNALLMIKRNIWVLVGFEAVFKLLSTLIFMPLFLGCFNLIMKYTGFTYLTFENIFAFLSEPITLLLLLLLIIFMTFYTMFDITTIIIILDLSYQNKKAPILDVLKLSFKKCLRIFNPINITISFFILFLIPFLNIGLTSSFISSVSVPEFILDFIKSNIPFLCIFALVMIYLVILLFRWLYSLHFFVLENVSFRKARKLSKNLSAKRHIKDFLSMFIVQFTMVLLYLIFIGLGILLILGIQHFLGNIVILESVMTTIIWVFIALSLIVFLLLITPISYTTISVLYYDLKEKREEEIKYIEIKETEIGDKNNRKLKKIILGFIVLAIICGSVFTYGIYKGKYNLNIEFTRTLEVTAHRGASLKYPENTMSAFKGAKELGADWIELDVAETKDGYIVVTHDTNFKRTAGVDKNIWDMTLEEVKELDVGSFFNKKFKGEKVPTLEETLLFAKNNNIKLNIELKPTGKEHDFEKKVVDLIVEHNYLKYTVITSQTYEVLENVKKYNKDVETVYVMSLAYGNITSLEYADHFSIEATSVTKSLVKKVHKEGKELYAWTVNTEDSIMEMIDLKVDNIITDDITLAKDTIISSKQSDLISEYIKFIEGWFA